MLSNSNRAIKALLLLSALALLAGCKLGPQKEAFLFTDDERVLFVQWTRVDRQFRGTIDISEKMPDNEIKTTHIAFYGVSEGDSVLSDGVDVDMKLKSSWTAHGGDKKLKVESGGFLSRDTLMLPIDGDQSPLAHFRRATATEHDEATRKLQMSPALNKVVDVSDGDTITVLDEQKRQHRVRLEGIDAPESAQDFGSLAKESLSDMVSGKRVMVTSSKKDKNGRMLGRVTLNGKDVGQEQINRGLAWFYRQYAVELPADVAAAYELSETRARQKKRKLWTDASPVPPWDFRRGKTTKASGVKPTTATATGPIIGNRSSKIYHMSNCPDYSKVSERNRVPFKTEAEAQAAGYRKAKNCPQ